MKKLLIVITLSIGAGGATPAGSNMDTIGRYAVFQGIWEQIGLEAADGKWEKMPEKSFKALRIVMINQGAESYWIGSTIYGAVGTVRKIQFPEREPANAIDFVRSDGTHTARYLFEATKTQLTFCWHFAGKSDRRPDQIKPTSDGYSVNTFQKLAAPPPLLPAAPKDTKWLSGVWDTVGFSVDGKPLEAEFPNLEFRKAQNVYHFDSDLCTIFGSDADARELTISRQHYRFRSDIGKDAIDFVDGKKVKAARFVQVGDSLRIAWTDSGERPKSVDPAEGNKVISLVRLVLERKNP